MNGKAKSSRLLCSITSGEAAEPVLKVFDMNLKDSALDCSADLRRTMGGGRSTHKPQNSKSKPNIAVDYLLCETEPSKRYQPKQANYDLQPINESIMKKLSQSSSQVILQRTRQTMPSSRQTIDYHNEDHPFRPTLSKKSHQLAKIRSNLNLTVFQHLYCTKPKCNHTFDSKDKQQRHSHNSRSKKSSGKAIREDSFKRTQQIQYRTDRSLTPDERQADDNLLEFLNRKLRERR